MRPVAKIQIVVNLLRNEINPGAVKGLGDVEKEGLEQYRIHLKQKYGSLAALNDAWKSDYLDWSEIRLLGGQLGGVPFNSLALRDLIRRAYRLQKYQVRGGPSWIKAQRFDVLANAARPRRSTRSGRWYV